MPAQIPSEIMKNRRQELLATPKKREGSLYEISKFIRETNNYVNMTMNAANKYKVPQPAEAYNALESLINSTLNFDTAGMENAAAKLKDLSQNCDANKEMQRTNELLTQRLALTVLDYIPKSLYPAVRDWQWISEYAANIMEDPGRYAEDKILKYSEKLAAKYIDPFVRLSNTVENLSQIELSWCTLNAVANDALATMNKAKINPNAAPPWARTASQAIDNSIKNATPIDDDELIKQSDAWISQYVGTPGQQTKGVIQSIEPTIDSSVDSIPGIEDALRAEYRKDNKNSKGGKK